LVSPTSRAARSLTRWSRAIESTLFTGGSSLSSQSLPSPCSRRLPNAHDVDCVLAVDPDKSEALEQRRDLANRPDVDERCARTQADLGFPTARPEEEHIFGVKHAMLAPRGHGRGYDSPPYRICRMTWSLRAPVGHTPHELDFGRPSRRRPLPRRCWSSVPFRESPLSDRARQRITRMPPRPVVGPRVVP